MKSTGACIVLWKNNSDTRIALAHMRKGEMMDDMATLILIGLLVIVTAVGLYVLIDITADMSRKIDKWKKDEEERRNDG